MFQSAIDRWSAWPTWAKWASGIGGVVLIEAIGVASQERNFGAALIQHSFALVLRYGVLAAAISGGVWAGMQIGKRSRQWVGWVAGIVLFFAIAFVGYDIARSIPGIGWRITAMMDSDCYVDWDGRSNPTVC